MFGKLHLLLATACTLALIVQGYSDCPVAQWGQTTSDITVIGPLVIDGNKREVDLNIPYPQLLGCDVVGVSAFTCDYGLDTKLHFVERFTVHTSRIDVVKTVREIVTDRIFNTYWLFSYIYLAPWTTHGGPWYLLKLKSRGLTTAATNTTSSMDSKKILKLCTLLFTLHITRASNDVSSFQLLARLSFPTVETKPYNMPGPKDIDPRFNYAEEKFKSLKEYTDFLNSRMKEPHNPSERREIMEVAFKKLFNFIDLHLKDLKRLLFATDMALMSMVLLKLNKKMDTSEAKIKSTQAKIPFGLYTSPEFKCLDTSYYIVSAHNQEDAQMILSSERKPHCYTFRGAFAFIGFYHRHSETTYVGPHAEQFQAKDPSQGLYCHSDDNWSDAQCIYKINPREEFPESVEYEPKISYVCGPYRYFIPATTDVRCIFSIFSMNFIFRFGYDGVTYKSSDLSFMYQNGQVFYTDEPWAGMSCWNWACKWRHNQNQRSNEFFIN